MKKITFIYALLLVSSFSFAQTYYSQNFDTGGLNSWVSTDLNTDGSVWAVLDASGIDANFGTGSLVSRSWTSSLGPINPDNLITSPLINLTAVTASNVNLIYNFTSEESYFAEHYAVYVTTTNVATSIITTTPVFETTISEIGFQTQQVNLTSFIGQNVYVSFRHFNCYDQNYLVIDNIELKSLQANDVQLVSSSLNRYGLLNSANQLALTVKNQGGNPVTNLTVNWNDGADHSSVVNVSIPAGATATVNHPQTVGYAFVTEKDIAITISQVNGATDPAATDNVGNKKFNTISQSSTKNVFFEEGTGTWCGWCPRGTVAMNYMSSTYPNDFIGVAVHNGDPMTLAEYDNGAAFTGFPGMNVDRTVLGEGVSQNLMISYLNERKALPIPVGFNAYGSITGSNVTINAYATFRSVFANANFRLGVIISEDAVSGTASGYGQVNYYAGGSNGAMGGYESLPATVPAAQMVYNHVGRALLGGYSGQANSVPTTITDGQVINYSFNYAVPSSCNFDNMHAIIVLIDQESGEIVNAKSVLLSSLTLGNNDFQQKAEIKMYPNPTSDFITLNNLESSNYNVTIFDISGKAVQSNKNCNVSDSGTLTVPVSGLTKGIYMVNIATGNSSWTKQLIVN